jgi:hypothetical protein
MQPTILFKKIPCVRKAHRVNVIDRNYRNYLRMISFRVLLT